MCKFTLTYFFLFFTYNISAQTNFYSIISYLASDSLEGRAPATKADSLTQHYLIQYFSKENLSVSTQKFSFPNENRIDSATNILAYLDNKKDSTILLSAHYDHLGWGNKKSREILKKHQIHNGADDNASGVAMLLALASDLAQKNRENSKYNYLFLASSAHEMGLFGAKYFVESSTFQQLKIRLLINFDMVGRLSKINPTVKIGGTNTDSLCKHYFQQTQFAHFSIRLADEQLYASDATPFYEKGIACLSFTTGTHEDYHRASDDSDKINYKGMEDIFTEIKHFLFFINH